MNLGDTEVLTGLIVNSAQQAQWPQYTLRGQGSLFNSQWCGHWLSVHVGEEPIIRWGIKGLKVFNTVKTELTPYCPRSTHGFTLEFSLFIILPWKTVWLPTHRSWDQQIILSDEKPALYQLRSTEEPFTQSIRRIFHIWANEGTGAVFWQCIHARKNKCQTCKVCA